MSRITRRRLLATAAVSGGLGAALTRVGGSAHDPTEADGWRHPQAMPGNAAATAASGPRTATDGVDWRLRIDAPLQYRFRGLAHRDGILFVPTHERVLGVSTDGERRFASEPAKSEFAALEPRSQIDSDPRVFRRRCFVASQSTLYALDVDDGRPRWYYEVNSSIDGVVLLGNTLYLTARVGSDNALVAIAATDGEQRWRKRGRLVPLAATDDCLVAATYDEGQLRGIDPATGDRRWASDLRVPAPSLNPGTVAIADDTLWHVRDGRLTAADAATGEPRWDVALEGDGSSFGDRFAVADAVYVLEPESNHLSAFELDGERRWSRGIQNAGAGISVGAETAYVATADGLEAVATADGERRFRVAPAQTAGDALTPLVTDGAVYGCSGDTLYGVSES